MNVSIARASKKLLAESWAQSFWTLEYFTGQHSETLIIGKSTPSESDTEVGLEAPWLPIRTISDFHDADSFSRVR